MIADAAKFEAAYVPVPSIGMARLLPDGNHIQIPTVAVTAVFDSEFYIEELDRSAGVKVYGSGVAVGDLVEVYGELSTVAGERVIANATVNKPGGTTYLEPLALTGRDLDVAGMSHLCTAGLLVTVWGKVQSTGTDNFYVDDGSALEDGSGNIGLRIDASSLSTPPDTATYAIVTGVVGAEVLQSGTVPLIRPRSPQDFIFHNL